MKLYKGLECPLDGYEIVLFSLSGPDGKIYPLCPYCYNNPPFENALKVSPCLSFLMECQGSCLVIAHLHPTALHVSHQKTLLRPLSVHPISSLLPSADERPGHRRESRHALHAVSAQRLPAQLPAHGRDSLSRVRLWHCGAGPGLWAKVAPGLQYLQLPDLPAWDSTFCKAFKEPLPGNPFPRQ